NPLGMVPWRWIPCIGLPKPSWRQDHGFVFPTGEWPFDPRLSKSAYKPRRSGLADIEVLLDCKDFSTKASGASHYPAGLCRSKSNLRGKSKGKGGLDGGE